MIEANFIIAPQIPSWSCSEMHTKTNSIIKPLTVDELNKVSEKETIFLSICKEGFETDTLFTKSENLVFFKRHLFEKINDLINLNNFKIYQCEDKLDSENKYTLLARNCSNLYVDLISEKGISITPGVNQFIYFSEELVEKINELKSFGFLFRDSNIIKNYPNSLTFKEMQSKAKEICEYAKVVAKVLKLDDEDIRVNEIGFQEDYPISIINQKNPHLDWAYISFYESAAISIRDYLLHHLEEKSLVDKMWIIKKGSSMPPLLAVPERELKEDPVAYFVEIFLNKIDPISFGTKNAQGSTSLKEIFDKVKKEEYSFYKSTLYETLYRGIAQITSQWSIDKLTYVDIILEKHNAQSISKLILNDEYFSNSFKNQPLKWHYVLPTT